MNLRIPTWRTIVLLSAAITTVAVVMPCLAVIMFLWNVPLEDKLPDIVVTATLPFFITVPMSVFGLYIVKTLYITVDRLDQLVRFDAMTGLLSRTHFMSNAENFRRNGGFLILADADKFKSINDTFGHEAGDEALKHLAFEMQRVFGPHGMVARMGGEEFGVYLADISRQQVELLIASLGTKLRSGGFRYRQHHLTPKLSLGVVATSAGLSATCMLSKADEALYSAKRQGGDNYVFAQHLDEKAVIAA